MRSSNYCRVFTLLHTRDGRHGRVYACKRLRHNHGSDAARGGRHACVQRSDRHCICGGLDATGRGLLARGERRRERNIRGPVRHRRSGAQLRLARGARRVCRSRPVGSGQRSPWSADAAPRGVACDGALRRFSAPGPRRRISRSARCRRRSRRFRAAVSAGPPVLRAQRDSALRSPWAGGAAAAAWLGGPLPAHEKALPRGGPSAAARHPPCATGSPFGRSPSAPGVAHSEVSFVARWFSVARCCTYRNHLTKESITACKPQG